VIYFSYAENGFTLKRLFHTNGLMRTRLTPDASKMVICTTSGYLMIIHDLDLHKLSQDLQGFMVGMLLRKPLKVHPFFLPLPF